MLHPGTSAPPQSELEVLTSPLLVLPGAHTWEGHPGLPSAERDWVPGLVTSLPPQLRLGQAGPEWEVVLGCSFLPCSEGEGPGTGTDFPRRCPKLTSIGRLPPPAPPEGPGPVPRAGVFPTLFPWYTGRAASHKRHGRGLRREAWPSLASLVVIHRHLYPRKALRSPAVEMLWGLAQHVLCSPENMEKPTMGVLCSHRGDCSLCSGVSGP